jgi:hypothetical protein
MPISTVRNHILAALAVLLAAVTAVALVAGGARNDHGRHHARLGLREAREAAERLGVESPGELMRANGAIAARLGEPTPGELHAGVAQAARLRAGAAAAGVPGSGGSWTPVGTTPLIDDDPTYPAANGDGFGKINGRVSDFAYDPASKTIFATVAQGGVWKTTDNAAHWTPIGDTLPIGSTSGIAWTTAGGGTLIVSTGDHAFSNDYPGVGVYWTTDQGTTWVKAKGVPDGALSFRVAVDPTNPAVVYVATGAGLFRSADAGRHFANVNLPTGPCTGDSSKPDCFFANMVTDVAVQPADKFGHKGGAVIAAIGWRAGRQPNFDGKPEAPYNGIYKSPDGTPGSFKQIKDPGFADPAITGRTEFGVTHGPEQNSGYLYAIVQNTDLFSKQAGGENDIPLVGTPSVLEAIYVSSDFGDTWTVMESRNEFFNPANGSALSPLLAAGIAPGFQTTYNEWLQVDPTRQSGGVPTRVLLGMEEVWQTASTQSPQDGHSQFLSIGMYTANGGACLVVPEQCGTVQANKQDFTTTHPDQHGALALPDGKGGLTLFVGNDGGVYSQHVDAGGELSQNGWGRGNNEGFHTLLPYGASMAKDGTVYAGLQDNGELKITPDGKQFTTYVGDGIFSVVDPDNSKVAWGELPATPVYYTTDGGQTWTQSNPGHTDADFVAPFAMDPANPKHLVSAGRQIKETTAGTDTADGCLNDPSDPTTQPPLCTEDDTTWHTTFDLGTRKHPGDAAATAETDANGKPVDDIDNLASAIDVRGADVYVGWCGGCDPVKLNIRFKNGFATNVGGAKPPKAGAADGWHLTKAAGLPNRLITSVAADPQDPRTVYVTLGCCGARYFAPIGSQGEDAAAAAGGNVYKSTDAGESFHDVSGDLPKVQATWIVPRDGQLVVATSIGAFISRDSEGHDYVPLGTGLPPTAISQISLKPGDPGTLVAATFGRGVYRYRFAAPTNGSGEPGPGCRDRIAPVSHISKRSATRRGLTMSGRTSDRGCGRGGRGTVKRVIVSLARATGRLCRYVNTHGRLGKRFSCHRTKYLLTVKGTTRWTLRFKHRLPAGKYKLWVRGIDAAGNRERKKLGRNGVTFRIR